MDWDLLERSVNSKTKLLCFSNPQNPTGKIFTKEDIDKLEQIMAKHPHLLVWEDCCYEANTMDNTPFYYNRLSVRK
jgi:aspartate aminotransferase